MVEGQLANRLPQDWSFRLEREPRGGNLRADAALTLRSPDGRFGTVIIEVKTRVEPRLLPWLKSQAEQFDCEAFVVAAPFLSPRTRKLLSDANLSYADLTGNLRLSTSQPALFIETEGATKNPWREPRPLKSLRGRAATRVIRGLCDFRPPYNIGELAEKSGASPPTTSRVVAFLESEALLTKEGRGLVTDVDWCELIARWTQDYSVLETNTAYRYLEARGLASLRDKLSGTGAEYAVTGSLAAQIPTSVAPARLALVYVNDNKQLADRLALQPTDTGANVLLLEPFDQVVFERTSERDGLTCAAFSQVAADLLTSPGRAPAEGEELLGWMKENEGEWRA